MLTSPAGLWSAPACSPYRRRSGEEAVIPKGVTWIKAAVSAVEADANEVRLTDGRCITYRYLVVCPGLQLNWNEIEGLQETIGKNGVCSNYAKETVEYTWSCLKQFRGGTALFTQPAMPIKCAGAPQKIMYLAADHWRRRGLAQAANIEFCLAAETLFGVPFFVPALQKTVSEYGVKPCYRHTLKAIDGARRTAVFTVRNEDGKSTEVKKHFDFIHVTPPQSSCDFIKQSSLSNSAGWVEVDPTTLQHTRYPNVFSLGDAAGTSNAKTAAAVRLQAPVVVQNLLAVVDGKPMLASYDGYGSCPLITAYGKVILAEFAYGGKVTPSFPIDPRKPRWSAWFLKKRILPFLYWKMMLRGNEFDIKHRERYFPEVGVA